MKWSTHRKERELLHIDAQIESDAKRVIAELNAQVERERLARIQIEESIHPRRLSLEQQKGIADRLRRFSMNIRPVMVANSDSESFGLATQIIAALQYGGLAVMDGRGNLARIADQPTPDSGVQIIRYHPDDEDLASTLADALTSIGGVKGVKLTRADTPHSSTADPPWVSSVRLMVEPKPIPLVRAVTVIQ